MLFHQSNKKHILLSVLFLFIGIIWPFATENNTFDIIVQIRQAIHSGDSGGLIIASMIACILFAIPNAFIYVSLEYMGCCTRKIFHLNSINHHITLISLYVLINFIVLRAFSYPYEPVSSIIGLFMTLSLVRFSRHEQIAMMPKILIAFQVFFYIQWFNIMPLFSVFHFGISDIPVSIKIASTYFANESVLNSVGFSFIIPLMISSIMTAFVFRLYVQNLKIVEENYERALALENMQTKIMDNRVYQEINALAHDLKTPLSTIRGLSSLLALNKDIQKLETYSTRIDHAIVKMTDMISSFLYGTSREYIEAEDLISYIRAQIPLEDEHIHFNIRIAPGLPPLYLNKIRMARAIVNLLENAILAPFTKSEKNIELNVNSSDENIIITISDNGMGIPEEDLEKIWLIGYSSKNTTGLGLPFAKQTIVENNGSISISSCYGEGTVVTVCIPIMEGELAS